MTYEVEDEVDWSDGSFNDDPPSTFTGTTGDSGYVSPAGQEDDGPNYLFEAQDEEEYVIPSGTALPSGILTIMNTCSVLTNISFRTSYPITSSTCPYRRPPQSPPAIRARLRAFRFVPG